jgi:hypothetical protein
LDRAFPVHFGSEIFLSYHLIMHQQSRDGVGYSRGVDHLASLSKGAGGGHLYRFLLMPLANDLER